MDYKKNFSKMKRKLGAKTDEPGSLIRAYNAPMSSLKANQRIAKVNAVKKAVPKKMAKVVKNVAKGAVQGAVLGSMAAKGVKAIKKAVKKVNIKK